MPRTLGWQLVPHPNRPFGFLEHLIHMETDWAVLLIPAPMTIVVAYFGAKQTGRLSLRRLRNRVGALIKARVEYLGNISQQAPVDPK